MTMTHRLLSGVWACVIAGSIVFITGRVWKGTAVDTSLLSLLPAAEGDPLLTEANLILSQRASRMMGFVVGHPQAATAAAMGVQLNEALKPSVFVENSLTALPPDQQNAFYELYFPLRYQILSPGDRQRLQSENPLGYFIGRLSSSLYSPASSFLKNLIPQDPFLFFPELVRSWASAIPQPASETPEGIAFVDTDGTAYAFAAVELALDPFDSKNQDRMLSWLAGLRKDFLAQWPGSHFYVSGVLPFASAERLRTEQEMKWVSLGSLVGVLLLTLLTFSSIRALLLAALPILVGFPVAVAATLLCFGNIHIITLAFGSSLIGVAIDYPLLYLAAYRTSAEAWDAREALRQIRPGLLLGAATTLMGYVALSLAPFPGLRQMALFSSVGLCAALITVLLWLPGFLTQGSGSLSEPRILSAGKWALAAWQRGWKTGSRKSAAVIGLAILLIFMIGGLAQLRFDDDIRRLQSPPESVAKEDAFVRRAMNGFEGNRFILIRGDTLEDLLQRQERLQDQLRPLLVSGTVSSIQSLAPFLPSLQRQQKDRYLLQTSLLAYADHVRARLKTVGLTPDVADHFLKELSRPMNPLSVEAWLASPASQLLRSLWIGSTAHGFASAALVSGQAPSGVLRESMKDLAGVRFFDQTEEYTRLFRRYRHLSMGLILGAYLGVWGLMMFRYGRKRGTWVTAPSVGGVLFTFALFGWCGVHVQLIHCLSALLVLSMGIDYTIYFAECARAHRPVESTLLAVELCACSALLSFGLLALCRGTPVLSSIGVTVFTGMAVAFVLSPLPYLESAA